MALKLSGERDGRWLDPGEVAYTAHHGTDESMAALLLPLLKFGNVTRRRRAGDARRFEYMVTNAGLIWMGSFPSK